VFELLSNEWCRTYMITKEEEDSGPNERNAYVKHIEKMMGKFGGPTYILTIPQK
jgi:hypothetical protein